MAAVMAAPVAALRTWSEAVAWAETAAREALAATAPLLDSLAALAAQMRAAQRLPWDATALGAFPELRARLWRKQRGAAEALLEQLGQRREELRAVRDAVGAAGSAVLRLVEERGPAELGLAAVLRRGPRCPSLADVLEGLQDVERYYRHLYLEIKLLLQRLSLDSLADVEALPQSWERILERYKEDDVVQDTLLKVSLFVENHHEVSCSPGS
ncbi:AFG2-interacting ribosome maturation factor [Zonotrichia albicollis]|uniref:AFG2-interacting ribosome maturation factor n=1 Tax=Zonotrichia albicollis TaxID=44394 RepID=UPI003D80F45E